MRVESEVMRVESGVMRVESGEWSYGSRKGEVSTSVSG